MKRKELFTTLFAFLAFFILGYVYKTVSIYIDSTLESSGQYFKVALALVTLFISLLLSTLTISRIFNNKKFNYQFITYFLIVLSLTCVMLFTSYLIEWPQMKRTSITLIHFLQGPLLLIIYYLGVKFIRKEGN